MPTFIVAYYAYDDFGTAEMIETIGGTVVVVPFPTVVDAVVPFPIVGDPVVSVLEERRGPLEERREWIGDHPDDPIAGEARERYDECVDVFETTDRHFYSNN